MVSIKFYILSRDITDEFKIPEILQGKFSFFISNLWRSLTINNVSSLAIDKKILKDKICLSISIQIKYLSTKIHYNKNYKKVAKVFVEQKL